MHNLHVQTLHSSFHHCLLQASKFNDRHTGDNIALMFADCFCQWEIQPKIVCVLRDGGTNFVAGF